jgi:Nuclear cap-binding protein subunit 3
MASSLSQLSACVTRILTLTGFPKELKTRDIQTAFAEWENVNGGFKIKWIDDTSLLIVFQDATVGSFPLFFFSTLDLVLLRVVIPPAHITSYS